MKTKALTTKSNGERKSKRNEYEEKLIALHRHASQLSSATNVDEVVKYTLDAMEFTLGFSSANFSLVDAERRCLRFKGKRGTAPSFSDLPLDGPGVTVKAANTGRTVTVSDTRREEAYVDDEGRAGKEASPAKLSELAVPVVIDETVVAVLNVENNLPNAFVDDDQKLLETLATHAASALRRLKEEGLLRESEERYRLMFENTSDAVVIYHAVDGGKDFVFKAFNCAAEGIEKVRREDVIGKNIAGVFPGVKDFGLFEVLERVLRTGKPEHYPATLYKDERIAGWRDNYVYKLPSGEIVVIYQDVTERKHAEEALRKSEERYRSLFQNMLEGFAYCKMILDDDGRPEDFVYLDVNSAFSRLTGLRNVVGKRVTEVIPGIKEENPALFEIYGRVALTGKPENFEVDLKSLGMSLAISVSSPARGNFVSVFENITDRKRVGEALRHRVGELAVLQETVLEITGRHDLPELLNSIVERAARLLGATSGGMYLCDSEKQEVRCVVSYNTAVNIVGTVIKYGEGAAGIVATTGKPLIIDDYRTWPGRAAVYEKDQPFSSVLSAPMIWQGQVTGVIHVLDNKEARHFTQADLELLALFANHAAIALENQRSLEALRENEVRFRKVFDEAPFGMALVRPDYRFARVNKTFCTVLGYSEEELTTLKFTDITHPDDIKLGVELSQKLFRGEIPSFSVEKRYIRKNGEVLSARLTASFIWDGEGNPIYSVAMIDDITERNRTEAALRESEERYRAMVENSPNFIGILQDGVLKYVNSVALLDLGWTREELLSPSFNPIENAVSEKSRSVLKENITRRLRGERVAPYEISLTKKDGSEVPVMVRAAKITYHQRPAIEFVFDDITERKRAEEDLRQSEERYRSLFDRMLDGIYLSTHEGRFVDVNPAFVRMFGYSSKQEMLDISDIKKELYFLPKERGSHILDTGQEEVEVYRMRRKDGSEVWVEDHGGYVHDEQGNIIYHEGILRDVTQRKRLEEELKHYSAHLEELVKERSGKLAESEARYRRLFEGSPISLWEEDFSEVKKYLDDLRSRGTRNLRRYFIEHPEDLAKCATMVKILDVNEATLRLYGAKTVEELRGELGRVFTHEFHDKFREELVALGEGKTQFASEFDNQTLTGDTKHVSVILSVIPGYEDTLAKVLVSTIDLTERKEMEQRLQQADRLAAVGETAAMVGHDLRNPLQGIAGAVHLLKQEALTAKERDEMLRLIEDSVGYSDTIVRDLTEYSAEIKLNLIETTPKSIVREALGKVSVPRVVTVHDRSEERPTIKVDSDRMKRVFINLVDNAIDAMPQGGILTISGKRSDGSVEIEFSDTGSGMPEKVMKNLWKPLQTTKAKGLGLGLAICKRVVDAHGGSISVKSKAGEGTTVTIRLPIKPDAAEVTQE